MQKKSILYRLALLLFLLFIIIIGSIAVRFIVTDGDSQNTLYIPSKASRVLKIDGKSFLKKSVSAIIFNNSDSELNKLIHSFVSEQREDSKLKNSGINLLSDIVFFTDQLEDQPIFGVLVNVSDRKLFEAFIESEKSEHKAGYLKEDVGIIVIKSQPSSYIKSKLIDYCVSALAAPTNHPIKTKDNSQIEIKFNGSEKDRITDGFFHCSIEKSSINFYGEINSDPTTIGHRTALSPDGFHLTTGQFPVALNDTLKSILNAPELGINTISLNYYHSTIEEVEKVKFSPQFDAIIGFKDSNNATSFIQHLNRKGVADSFNTSSLYVGTTTYQHELLKNNQLFIGIHPFSTLTTEHELPLVSINGSPSCLTKIEGDGFIRRLLTIVPVYSSSNHLASTISGVDINSKRIKENIYKIQGSIQFKEGNDAIIELVRFLLAGQFLQ